MQDVGFALGFVLARAQSVASSGGFARWSRHFLALLVQNGGLRALALREREGSGPTSNDVC
jgi:hypothetical protein